MSLLLAGYSSGSDSEGEAESPAKVLEEAPAPAAKIVPASAPGPKAAFRKKEGRGKRRKRRIRTAQLLPPHLQRALETGVLLSEEEDEVEPAGRKAPTRDGPEEKPQRKTGPVKKNQSRAASMLAALPPPTQGGDAGGSEMELGKEAKAARAPRDDAEVDAATESMKMPAPGEVSDDDSDEDSDENDSDDDLPFALRAHKPPAAEPVPAPAAVLPTLPSLYRSAEETARAQAEATAAAAMAPGVGSFEPPGVPPPVPPPGPPPGMAFASAPPYAAPADAQAQAHAAQAAYGAAAPLQTYAPDSFGQQNDASASRRKRRRGDEEIAAALQSGDMAALNHLTGGMHEWQQHNPAAWDQHAAGATTNPVREVKIETKFYGRGEGDFLKTDAPLRVHRQKHQINQLAADALRMEADMLDRKSKGLKTKAQTAAKYGW